LVMRTGLGRTGKRGRPKKRLLRKMAGPLKATLTKIKAGKRIKSETGACAGDQGGNL